MAKLSSQVVEIKDDSIDAVFDEYYKQGWTDGLPIIPATAERVERMIAGAGRPADEVLGEVPPKRAPATVEKLAVNAVMAGCLPEYFPVVLATVEAILEPKFDLYGVNTTTSPVCVVTVVNGPIREQLDINSSYGLFGPGRRANATIGRAVRLIQLNLGGAEPGPVSKSTQGQPGRYTFCFGEFEEKNPWKPLHVEHGFKKEDSTVTVFGGTCTVSFIDVDSKTALGTLTTAAHSMDILGTNNMTLYSYAGESLLVLCPDHAMVIARDGMSKADVQKYLVENVKRPVSDWPAEKQGKIGTAGWPTKVINGYTQAHIRPEQFEIVVGGGLGGYHSCWIPTFGHTYAITKKIRKKGK
ncbi:MAG: hypothetical protein HYX92_08600 [Chloroflexi bacterium]|nr:hypothetical protein [Chloroflexota bacterium]